MRPLEIAERLNSVTPSSWNDTTTFGITIHQLPNCVQSVRVLTVTWSSRKSWPSITSVPRVLIYAVIILRSSRASNRGLKPLLGALRPLPVLVPNRFLKNRFIGSFPSPP